MSWPDINPKPKVEPPDYWEPEENENEED